MVSHPEAMGGPVKREEGAKVKFDDFQVFEELFHRNGDSFSDSLQRQEEFKCYQCWILTRYQVSARQLGLSGLGCLIQKGGLVMGTNARWLKCHGLHKEQSLGLSGRVDQMPSWPFLPNSLTPRGNSISDKMMAKKQLASQVY